MFFCAVYGYYVHVTGMLMHVAGRVCELQACKARGQRTSSSQTVFQEKDGLCSNVAF